MDVGSPLSGQQRSSPPDVLGRTAERFEAIFAGEMAKLMLESVEINGEFGGGHGEDMFRGMLAEEIGNDLARNGGLRLAPVVLDQLIKMQDASQ